MNQKETMFTELKNACLSVWENYKDRPGGYYEEKVNYVNRITNPDEAFILVNMFDTFNQKKLRDKLSDECKRFYGDYFLVSRLFFFNEDK